MEVNDSSAAIPLSDGGSLPAVGLGTWKIAGDQAADVLSEAIRIGYRHLDCACDYGNEPEVGHGLTRALAEGVCRRDELWVTSKLWNTYHDPRHVRPACERSLRDLQLDVLDLYLVHFPIALEYVPFERRYPPGWFFDPDASSAQDATPSQSHWRTRGEPWKSSWMRAWSNPSASATSALRCCATY